MPGPVRAQRRRPGQAELCALGPATPQPRGRPCLAAPRPCGPGLRGGVRRAWEGGGSALCGRSRLPAPAPPSSPPQTGEGQVPAPPELRGTARKCRPLRIEEGWTAALVGQSQVGRRTAGACEGGDSGELPQTAGAQREWPLRAEDDGTAAP